MRWQTNEQTASILYSMKYCGDFIKTFTSLCYYYYLCSKDVDELDSY